MRQASHLWGLTPYAFKTLRSDGEQLNGNQVKNALSPPLTASLAPGSTPGALALLVHVWRNACGISSLAALVPVFLGGFFMELLARNLTATIGGTAFSVK
jgi:hypothetical protein